MPGLPVHIISTYFGKPTPRSWRCGRFRLTSTGHPGGTTVIPAGWGGYWDIDGDSLVSYLILSDARLQNFAAPFIHGGKLQLIPRIAEPDPVGARLLRALSREAAKPNPAGQLFVEQLLDLFCMHVVRVHSSSALQAAPAPSRGLAPWQVRRVTAYMTERLDQEIGLDELAELTSLSRSHFCTAFRHATGRTPHEWLTGLRLERARELLRNRKNSITDVALAVGYQTSSAFTSTFRRHTGATPSDYRRCL
jgi:AraC family transcriptional regulator